MESDQANSTRAEGIINKARRMFGRGNFGKGRNVAIAAACVLCAAAGVVSYMAITRPPHFNLVLVLVDTLRADHLGCYGYARDTSPNIDKLAAEGTVFLRNMSQSSFTANSVASLMVSQLVPGYHIPEDSTPIAEVLAGYGYQTVQVQTNPWITEERGFTRGFSRYRMISPPTSYRNLLGWHAHPDTERNVFYADAETVRDAAREEITALDPGRPFFLYVHYMDVHSPYVPKAQYDVFSKQKRDFAEQMAFGARFRKAGLTKDMETVGALRDEAVALYDGEVHQTDASVGALVDLLRERGLYDNTLIIVVADHGEEFGEHGIVEHGNGLYETQLHTPLIMKFPKEKQPVRVSRLTRNIDVVPTALVALGLSEQRLKEHAFSGAPLRGSAADEELPAKAMYICHTPDKKGTRGFFSVESGGFKLISEIHRYVDKALCTHENMLFHISDDPGEMTRLEETLPEKVAELTSILPSYRILPNSYIEIEGEIRGEQERRLRALGYLN